MKAKAASPFHPDLHRSARLLPRQMVSPSTLRPMRRVVSLMALRGRGEVESLTLADGRKVRLHRPSGVAAPGPALLWLHGGGYVMGSPGVDDLVCRRFADRLGITVAAPSYRLAPEHPYPAGLQDAYSVLTWLAGLPDVDPTRVAIGGESAGGGLAAALALYTRDRGELTLARQILSYPMLDDRSATAPGLDSPNQRLWNQTANDFAWSSYLGSADPQVAVPARHLDLSGLAPAWLGVGTNDLFHDEVIAYAERLDAAGVESELCVVPGAYHAFDNIVPNVEVSRMYFDSQCESLQKAFATK